MDSGSTGNKLIIPARTYVNTTHLGGHPDAPSAVHPNNSHKGFINKPESQAFAPLPYNPKDLNQYTPDYTDIKRKPQDNFKPSSLPDYVNQASKLGSIPSSAISKLSAQSSNTSVPSLIKNIKDIFESKRRNALEKEKIKIDSIKLKTYQKIKDLIELENYLISQIDQITLNIEPGLQVPITKANLVQAVPVFKDKQMTTNVFEGYLINNTHISVDLVNVKSFEFPPTFAKGSNFTFFNQNEILVADSECCVFSINVHTGYRKGFGKFKVKRSFFSLCIIKNIPYVIGGIDPGSKSVCNTVEYLQGSRKWIKGSSLNQSRSHCSSICYQDSAFVMGGFSGGYLDSIEKFGDTWELLKVSLPSPMSKFILCSKGTDIYIFGGKSFSGEIRSVHIFDTIEEKIRKSAKNLGKSFEETNNGGVIFRNDQFYILDSTKVIKYKE